MKTITVARNDLARALRQVGRYTERGTSEYSVLSGVNVSLDGFGILLRATDRYRAAVANIPTVDAETGHSLARTTVLADALKSALAGEKHRLVTLTAIVESEPSTAARLRVLRDEGDIVVPAHPVAGEGYPTNVETVAIAPVANTAASGYVVDGLAARAMLKTITARARAARASNSSLVAELVPDGDALTLRVQHPTEAKVDTLAEIALPTLSAHHTREEPVALLALRLPVFLDALHTTVGRTPLLTLPPAGTRPSRLLLGATDRPWGDREDVAQGFTAGILGLRPRVP